MELVYPVYVDTPMMTAFLASLEGGIIEEADIEGKTSTSQERSGTASLSSKVSGLLSNLIDFEGKGELARKTAGSSESQYKSTIRFPNAALFIRLRELLYQQEIVKAVDSDSDFSSIRTGDLIEFEGLAVANPGYQIRRVVSQLVPILEINQKTADTQLDQVLAILQNVKPNKPVLLGEEEKIFQDQAEITLARETIKLQKQRGGNELALYKAIGESMNSLFPEDAIDNLIFKMGGLQAVCRVYPAFARDERVQDIHDGRWRCLGKVIGHIEPSSSYDLLKGMPMGYLANEQFANIASNFNTDEITIEVTEPKVHGPAFVVATLGIFA